MKRTIKITLEVPDDSKEAQMLGKLPESMALDRTGSEFTVRVLDYTATKSRPGGENTESGGEDLM